MALHPPASGAASTPGVHSCTPSRMPASATHACTPQTPSFSLSLPKLAPSQLCGARARVMMSRRRIWRQWCAHTTVSGAMTGMRAGSRERGRGKGSRVEQGLGSRQSAGCKLLQCCAPLGALPALLWSMQQHAPSAPCSYSAPASAICHAAMNEVTWNHVANWEQLHCQECAHSTLLHFQGRPDDLRCAQSPGLG